MAIKLSNGRYYLILYAGIVDGKQKQKWIPLTKDLATSSTLAAKITNGNIKVIGCNVEKQELVRFIGKALRSCQRRSRERLQENNLTTEFLIELAERDKWRCSVTGVKYDLRQLNKNHGRPFAPSIDRINPSFGYTTDNVRLVCVAANYAMNQWGQSVLDIMLSSYRRKTSRTKSADNEAAILATESLVREAVPHDTVENNETVEEKLS